MMLHCMKSIQSRSFFWSVFSCIRTEYRDLLGKSPYFLRIQENTDQKKLRFGHFSRTNHNANATSYRKYKHCDSDKSKTNVSDTLPLEDTLTLDAKVSKDTFIDSPDKNPLFKGNN